MKVKIVMSILGFILLLALGYIFVQALPLIGLFVAIFGLIVLGFAAKNNDADNLAWGVVIALAGLFIILIGFKLNTTIEELGIVGYLKNFFSYKVILLNVI